MALPFSRSPMTRIGGGPLFPNMNIRPAPQAPTGFGGLPSQAGYTGSGWNYGGQSYAIPTNQSVAPGGASFAAPARAASPLSLNLTQAANRQVNQVLNPQLAAQAAYARQQNTAIQGFAQALMGKLQPIAGQVGADYDQAISQTGALANQAASFLQQANPTPQVQALLQSINAPAEQQAQIGGQLGQTFGGGAGVLSFLGGAVPGREMAADKAAAQTQAAQYPLLAALRGQQDLAGALGQQATARNQILATRGQLYSDARQQIIENNMNRAKERQQEKSDAATAAYHGTLLRQNAQRIKQAGTIAGRKLTQAGQIASGKLKEADAKRHDVWNIAATKADEVARYHDQTIKSRDFATKVRNRGITLTAKARGDENTTRIVHNAATETQASLDSINKKEHDDTMASLTEMGLTGIGADGKPTPKFQAELDKIHTDANAARQRVQQGWRKIHDAAVHNQATEAAATARANRPDVRSIPGGGLVAVYPNGTTKTIRKPSATATNKPFHFQGGDGREWIATPTKTGWKSQPIPGTGKGAAGATGLSPASTAVARRNAGKAMDLWYYGDEKKGISAIDYSKAVRLAMHQFSLSREDAIALANDFYAPGEGGRPTGNKGPTVRAKSKGPLGVQAVG